MLVADEKDLLTEIGRARERVQHWLKWKNEPSCRKKLGHWRRRLKKALAAATELGVEIPADPYAPPPPPTEEELSAAELRALRLRLRCDFQIQDGSKGWAPWGTSGWSAIVVTKAHYRWCRVNRVNSKTGEVVAKGKVRRDQILSREQDQKGKDKPSRPPGDVFVAKPDEEITEEAPINQEAPVKPERIPFTEEEMAAKAARIDELLGLVGDDSTTDDW